VAAPTLENLELLEESFVGNNFARRGSFTYCPKTSKKEHNRPTVSKSDAMEQTCSQKAGQPVSSPPNPIQESASCNPSTDLPKRKRGRKKTKHPMMNVRPFTVRMSLIQAAATTVVFPVPVGQTFNILRYILDASAGKLKKCKRCEKWLSDNCSLVKHWLQVHAYQDLEAAVNFPDADHGNKVINSPWRRDILLAALFTCPLDACRPLDLGSQVEVFMTKDCLAKHVNAHCDRLKDWGEEMGQDTTMEVQQMKECFSNYVDQHPFWQKKKEEGVHFTTRQSKLIWTLNQ